MACHSFLSGIFPTLDWTQTSCTEGSFYTIWTTREAQRLIRVNVYWAFPVRQLISCESLWCMPYVEITWPCFSMRQLLLSSANTGGEAEAHPGCSRAHSWSRCWDWAECRLWGRNVAWGRHSVNVNANACIHTHTHIHTQNLAWGRPSVNVNADANAHTHTHPLKWIFPWDTRATRLQKLGNFPGEWRESKDQPVWESLCQKHKLL